MQEKTFKKLSQKMQNKQRHYIDTSILVEILAKQKLAESCKNHIYSFKSGNKLCFTSSVCIGESISALTRFEEDYKEINQEFSVTDAFAYLSELIIQIPIHIVPITQETFNIIKEYQNNETGRLDSMDILNFASAKEWEAEIFITKDNDFKNKINLLKQGIKIFLISK
ncbi:MAG: PIN domain-containing protein [archaeon]|nr:PIN domain-containing protein [archaeon]